ncbi:hypothetical protein BGW42_005971 [Actinomortierella wolfii]|nr:hypothetical protein BGW42_005971 [Actinomortierella wolfii]
MHLYEASGMGSNRNKYFEQSSVDRRIKGLAEKLSLNGQSDRGQALEEYLQRLRKLSSALTSTFSTTPAASSSDRDTQNVVSSILLVLLELSESPTSVALRHHVDEVYEIPLSIKQSLKPPVDEAAERKAVWLSILKEEPLEGEHWNTARNAGAEGSDDSDYDDMDLVTMGKKPADNQQEPSHEHSGQDSSATSPRIGQLPVRTHDGEVDLRELESLQYWQASNISKKRHNRVEEQRQASISIQDPTLVNAGLEQFQNNVFAATTLPMDELDLIREVLLMLLGEYSICFERDEQNIIKPRKGIILSHVSPDTLNNILVELSAHGTYLNKIESLVTDICSRPTQSTESPEQASCAISSILLSRLYDAACQSELSGDWDAFDMFRSLLRDSMIPLLQSLEHWLNGDDVSDERDFFIKANPSVDLLSSDYWESRYSFQVDITEGHGAELETNLLIPSFFESDSLDMIIYIGKAARILEYANGFEARSAWSKSTTFAEDLASRIFGNRKTPNNPPSSKNSQTPSSNMAGIIATQFPLWTRTAASIQSPGPGKHNVLDPISNWSANDLTSSSTNLQWLLNRELTHAITDRYTRINQAIYQVMAKKCRLWWHVEGMCSFYFMMNGEVMNDFSQAVFKKLVLTTGASSYAKRQRGLDSYSLGALFSDVAEQHRWPMREFATVRHVSSAEVQKNSNVRPILEQLEEVEFDYIVLDVQRKDFERVLKQRQESLDLDELMRFSGAFVRTCHERLFLGRKASPLLRAFKVLLELAVDFSNLMSKYLALQDQMIIDEAGGRLLPSSRTKAAGAAATTPNDRVLSRHATRDHASGGSLHRRVSFGASQILRHTVATVESDDDEEEEDGEEEEEEEEEEEGQEKVEENRYSQAELIPTSSTGYNVHEKRSNEDEGHSLERAHEDIEMTEVPGRVPRSKSKKQKTSLTGAKGTPDEGTGKASTHSHSHHHQQQQRQQEWQRTKFSVESEVLYYMTKLQELEQELLRRKRFLAESLRIIVQSNVAKKSNRLQEIARAVPTSEGVSDEGVDTPPRESGSSYLNGLIYALSK